MVAETDELMCFFPLQPETLGHTLVAPKEHYNDMRDAPPQLGLSISRMVQMLSENYGSSLGTTAFNLLIANGQEAEQSVPHAHFHYLPRFADYGLSTWPALPPFKTDLDALLLKLRF